MADLTFSQPARRNLAVPILIALATLLVIAGLLVAFTPHSTAQVTVQKTAVYPVHLVFKSESIIVGRDTSQDELYVLVTLRIENHLRLPLFLKDFTATLNPSNPDGSPAESITTSTAQKTDVPNIYLSFPALKTLANQQASPLLLRETQIAPGASTAGMLLLHFPVPQTTWDKRKSATISIDLYHQQPLTIELPNSKP